MPPDPTTQSPRLWPNRRTASTEPTVRPHSTLPAGRPHLVVVGSGIAGLTAALDAAATHRVTLLAKDSLDQSNTRYAQGGIAVVSTPDDSVAAHVADTLAAGAGLSDAEVVRVLCAGGPDALASMLARGVAFDRDMSDRWGDGLAHGLEAAHSAARILHAGGDATGHAIVSALLDRLTESAVEVRPRSTVVDVVVRDGRAVGVRLLGGEELTADAVLLATGGAGQLYPFTTNPTVATADGVAMALRAGAAVADLEMYQFHPTSLDAPGSFLVSEAVRGEGAVLRDASGRRFMTDLHRDAELAPRDVVARGIAATMARTGRPVVLDATALGPDFLARRFPTIDAACRGLGLSWGTTPVAVTPAAHYAMGGVRTDSWGRTSVPGLLAVGEVACTGLHGANRLASNSLLDGAVFGARAVRGLREQPAPEPFAPAPSGREPADRPPGAPSPTDVVDQRAVDPRAVDPSSGVGWSGAEPVDLADRADAEPFTRADLQQLMWRCAGLARDAAGLAEAAAVLGGWRTPDRDDAKGCEDANLLLVARALVTAALARTESRGSHHRTDVPAADPAQAVHRSLVLQP